MHVPHLPAHVHRRDLLKGAAALAPAVIAGRAFAAPQAGSRLLVVFLRGAYDAANIVAPTGSDFYHQARPTIGLARPDAADPKAPLALDADWSLHPALKDSLYPLWQARQLAFVPFAGTDDMSRSHFETQDTIELGQPVGGHRDYGSGFMARLAAVLGRGGSVGDRPIAFTDQLPLCFRGGADPVPNLALANVGKPIDARQAKLIEAMYAGDHALGRSVDAGFEVRDTVYKALDVEMKAASRGAVSTKGFELSARRIGTLMRGQFNLAFVDAVGADAWRTTTVVVVSEFGRTFRENGDKGTDHGHGSVYWVLGGGVAGGRLVGEQVAIGAATLNQNRDLPVLTDYRSLIGGLTARQFGLSAERVAALFPQARPIDLKLI